MPLTQPTSTPSTPVASISSSLASSRFMPPTDGLDELALMRFRGECGWSSSTAISASRRSRIGADRRAAKRCVSSVRALCRAAPIARRNTESAGARTCSSRSQARARASSEAVRSSRICRLGRSAIPGGGRIDPFSEASTLVGMPLLALRFRRQRRPKAGAGAAAWPAGRRQPPASSRPAGLPSHRLLRTSHTSFSTLRSCPSARYSISRRTGQGHDELQRSGRDVPPHAGWSPGAARAAQQRPSRSACRRRRPSQEREAAADAAATCVGGEPADGEPARSSSR